MTTYPATATHTEKIDETRSFTEEHWAIDDYTLISRRMIKADGTFSARRWSVQTAEHGIPEIIDAASYDADLPEFGVNWSAMGTRNITETRKYASRLTEAARIAERFTMIVETIESE